MYHNLWLLILFDRKGTRMSAEGQESPRSKWRENHGNFLLGFVAFVLVVGAGLVIYRQNSSHSSTSPPNISPRPSVISVGSDDSDAEEAIDPAEADPAESDPAESDPGEAKPGPSAAGDDAGV